MASEPHLASCPFCGEAVQFRKALWPSDGDTDAIIHRDPSPHCGMTAFSNGTADEQIIQAWNTRAYEQARSPVAEDGLVERLLEYARVAETSGLEAPTEVLDYCRQKVADLRAAASALRGKPGWRPIEEAPKDGTEILLAVYREEFVDPIIMNSCWIDGEERGCYWLDWHGLPSPTHWQPLPPVPTEER